MQFAQMCDRVNVDAVYAGPLNISALPGTWINSNPNTAGIDRLIISEADGCLSLQVYATGPNGLIDWGTTQLNIFASSPSSRLGAGFTCSFDFGFVLISFQGMLMKGLLVLVQFHTFKDNSQRADYFVREYFASTLEAN